jgi:fermentation-respiration switch protein FrsA (DUF1100 family)
MVSTLIYIAGALLIGYCGLGLVLFFRQASFLYRPVRAISSTPADLGLDFESVTFTTSDGLRLNGWYIPAEDAELTILFCHGNGGNIMHRLDSISIFHDLGLNCFIFDYRGYGNSEGKPTEQGTYLDATAAHKWLTQDKKICAEDIIIFGRSLGGTIASHLATQTKAKGLVIESTFTSYVDIGRKFYPYMPVRLFARFTYNTADYIKRVRCPVMLIYSRDDEIVPFEFGLRLYEAANEPKKFVEIFGKHNDCFLVSSEIYKRAWTEWLKFLKENRSQAIVQQAS